ncbi:YwiC-like family protein [Georgenia yuyongxinii]
MPHPSTPTATSVPVRRRRRRRGPGWVPDQHGAWAMIVVPPLVGTALSGPAWAHVPLLGLWWVGYFAFFATGLWLRSRRKARYVAPVRAYGMAVLPLAAALLLTNPHLATWAVPFAPLVAVTLWCSARRRDRSLFNDVVTVGAAGLMTAVAYDAGTGGAGGLWGTGWPAGTGWLGTDAVAVLPGSSPDGSVTGWAWAWLVTALVTAYFLGTIGYVKTNIRERGNRRFLLGSVGYHVLVAVVVGLLAAGGVVSGWHAAVWVALLARAAAVPVVAARRGRPVRPLVIGVGEIVFSVLVPITLLG